MGSTAPHHAITGPLALKLSQLSRQLLDQIPSHELLLIKPGKPKLKPGSSTNGPDQLSPDFRKPCEEVRTRRWFSKNAKYAQIIVHADNACALESARLYVQPGTTVLFDYLQALWPFDGRSTSPLAFTQGNLERALQELIEFTEDMEMIERMADLPLIVVTQMGVEPNSPPDLALAIAKGLRLMEGVADLVEAHIDFCQGVLITPEAVEICR